VALNNMILLTSYKKMKFSDNKPGENNKINCLPCWKTWTKISKLWKRNGLENFSFIHHPQIIRTQFHPSLADDEYGIQSQFNHLYRVEERLG